MHEPESTYHVYIYHVTASQVGDHYSEDWGEPEELHISCIDMLASAKNAFDDARRGIRPFCDVRRQKTGLDIVTWDVYTVEREDRDSPWVDVVESKSLLPDDVAKAMRESERSYRAFLDYEDDEWSRVYDLVDARKYEK